MRPSRAWPTRQLPGSLSIRPRNKWEEELGPALSGCDVVVVTLENLYVPSRGMQQAVALQSVILAWTIHLSVHLV